MMDLCKRAMLQHKAQQNSYIKSNYHMLKCQALLPYVQVELISITENSLKINTEFTEHQDTPFCLGFFKFRGLVSVSSVQFYV